MCASQTEVIDAVMNKYEFNNTIRNCYEPYIRRIHISHDVSEIAPYSYSNRIFATSIIIPEGVTKIGKCAFAGCVSLKRIIIPKSVREIDEYAFEDCFNLESVKIMSDTINIKHGAFSKCQNLNKFILPPFKTNYELTDSLVRIYTKTGCVTIDKYALSNSTNEAIEKALAK